MADQQSDAGLLPTPWHPCPSLRFLCDTVNLETHKKEDSTAQPSHIDTLMSLPRLPAGLRPLLAGARGLSPLPYGFSLGLPECPLAMAAGCSLEEDPERDGGKSYNAFIASFEVTYCHPATFCSLSRGSPSSEPCQGKDNEFPCFEKRITTISILSSKPEGRDYAMEQLAIEELEHSAWGRGDSKRSWGA